MGSQRKFLKAIVKNNCSKIEKLLKRYANFRFEKILSRAVEQGSTEMVELLLKDERFHLVINDVAETASYFKFPIKNVSIILSDSRITNQTMKTIIKNSALSNNFDALDLLVDKVDFKFGLQLLFRTYILEKKDRIVKYLVRCLKNQDLQTITDIAKMVAKSGTNEMFLDILESPHVTMEMLYEIENCVSDQNKKLLDFVIYFLGKEGRKDIRKWWIYTRLIENNQNGENDEEIYEMGEEMLETQDF